MRHARTATGLVAGILLLVSVREATAGTIVLDSFNASLTTGSLAGTNFPVSFSFDASQISASGSSYLSLDSFDFTLFGISFNKSYILQGGQAIFQNGVLENVTASFQQILPPDSPVENITFGFGGNGSIAYIDLHGQFGSGSFAFVPEPASGPGFLVACAVAALGLRGRH